MPWALIGLHQAKGILTDMLRKDRVPHALLLTGPSGAGKFTLSMALAQALNCLSPDADLSPCLKCSSCLKIAALSHPDFLILEPKGRKGIIPIEEVRSLRAALNYKPFEGKRQVAVVRMAERFTEESGGALLKTLEEPSPSTVIILNAMSEASVMPTLVSRCSRMKVPPPPREALVAALSEKGCGSDLAALLAGLSGGALGAALGLDAAAAQKTFSDLDSILGLSGRPGALAAALEWTGDFCETMAKFKKREESYPKARELQDLVLSCLRLWHRDAASLAATGDPSIVLGPPASSAMWAWSKTITAESSRRFERSLARLAEGLARGLRLEIIFENFWLAVLKYEG
ncbi:MAG: DNA polymerase III subunit [Deltaproteobacteria bacterium]|jgi:DNA polymerase III delta' subunit|nr:DNA polymerase III subunit [Deltaproteobacteria bacterium]